MIKLNHTDRMFLIGVHQTIVSVKDLAAEMGLGIELAESERSAIHQALIYLTICYDC